MFLNGSGCVLRLSLEPLISTSPTCNLLAWEITDHADVRRP